VIPVSLPLIDVIVSTPKPTVDAVVSPAPIDLCVPTASDDGCQCSVGSAGNEVAASDRHLSVVDSDGVAVAAVDVQSSANGT